MRRVLQLSGLSGLLVTVFVSTHAFAQETADADDQQPAEGAKAEQPAPVAPAATVVAPAGNPIAKPAVAKPAVGDFSVHGYFRGGLGGNVSERGRMTCFQLNLGGLLSKYRLGNECEVWGELDTTTVIYAGGDGSVASLHFMPVAFIPTSYIGYSPTGVTSGDNGYKSTGATVAFPNLYVDIKGIPWLFGGTAWMGTRYYKRESVYISDFFYWNPSGVGGGIEDIRLGKIWESAPAVLSDLTFSYAVFAVDGEPKADPYLPLQIDFGLRNDFQIRGLRPWWGGELQFGFQYIADWSNDYSTQNEGTPQQYQKSNTHSGWGGTFQYVQDVLIGINKMAIQYGVGGGSGFGTLSRFYYPDFSLRQDATNWRFRALDVLTIQPTPWLGLQANVVFQHDKLLTPADGNWISAGTRVSFAFTEHAKLLAEVGHDRLKTDNGSGGDRQLTKVTGAIAITTAKGFWARPELRLFFTWALWDKNAAAATVDSGRLYTAADANGAYKLSGSLFGLQAEAIF
jgi:maltoporin